MIWIATLCLLIIAAWLLFNGLNERRWVIAHSHDETVANDEGLLMGLSSLTRSGMPVGDGKLSIDQEDSGFARAVTKVRASTSKYGDKFFEARAAAARLGDDEQSASAKDEESFFGRAVSKVGAQSARLEQRLDDKIKSASASTKSETGESEEGLVNRVSKKVATASTDLSQRVADNSKTLSQNLAGKRKSASNSDLFKTVSERFSADRNKVKNALSGSSTEANSDEDLVTRLSRKVGTSMEKLENKLVNSSKSTDN